jgi:tetratricopeptide (TPR) repeat protein
MSMARITTLFFLLALPLCAQRNPQATDQPKQLTIKVLLESGPPVGMGNRVQLLNGTGTPVTEGFTDDRGEAVFMVDAGTYRLRVTGNGIEEANSERSFYIDRRELVRTEFFTVKKKVDPNVPSLEPHVSAAMLKIPDKAKNELAKGMKELDKRNFDKAKPYFEKATEMYPQYAEAFNALGIVAMNTGAMAEGREMFDRAISADPEFAGSYVNKAKILMGEKQLDKSEELLKKSVTLDPLNAEALSLLAICQLQAGDQAGAISAANRTHQLPHEKWAIVHYVAGLAFEQQKLPADALREYKLFIKESPTETPTVAKVKSTITELERKKP